ncbi:CHASE2 domain-containing protein [Pantanalinema rosaneae CENA516]|uniref:CHASE2 domain-containing protein n=1 Tax=Pantanalinema rosaneae TaxID=1620701 RepID=UPI003D6FC60A
MWAKFNRQVWKWRGVWITAPIVVGILMLLRLAGALQPMELAALDWGFRSHPTSPVDERIVIIGITEADMQATGNWPMTDRQLAQLLTSVKQQQPRLIGLDLYRNFAISPGTEELEQLFASTPNLIGIQKVVGNEYGAIVPPPPALQALDQPDDPRIGANDLLPDADSKIRRSLLSLRRDENSPLVLGFGTLLALKYLEAEEIDLAPIEPVADHPDQYRLGYATLMPWQENDGGYVRASTGGYQLLMWSNLRYLGQRFETVSMTNVLTGKISPTLLRDRIVLIGVIAESAGDYFYIPYKESFFSNSFQRAAGVEIHADTASQILRAATEGHPLIRSWADPIEGIWILLWATIGATITWANRYKTHTPLLSHSRGLGRLMPKKRLFSTGLSIVSLSAALVIGSYQALLQGWWIPVIPPLLALSTTAIAITAYMARSAAGMRQTFGRYVTDEVVANILETPAGLKLGGETRKVTILISDLRGFSALSERLSPEKAVRLINFYLETMTEVINHYQGTINELMGDGIFVLFGAPIQRYDDSQRAVACAIAMQLAMDRINEQNVQLNLPLLEMGIGINTGEVLAGNIGSQRRAKYTVLGNAVNLASRIESYTVGGQVLISPATLQDVGDILRLDGQLRVQPKGFQEPIVLYEVGGIGGNFNLFLPKIDEALIELKRTIPIQFTVLEGKHLTGQVFLAEITQLSTYTAELQTEHPLDVLDNLKLNLVTGKARARGMGDIYAKVIERLPSDRCRIRFTAIPPEVTALFYYLRE